jgi:uncharacterized protein (DUF58 family)
MLLIGQDFRNNNAGGKEFAVPGSRFRRESPTVNCEPRTANRPMPASAEKYLRPDVIAQVKRLDLKARFIVEGFLAGLHNSPFHGFSVEFSEHRKYAPGDDMRALDWNVYAKTDRFYIKKFQAETNLDCYLLVDQSASMNYGSPGLMTKMDYAICLAAGLAFLMVRQQDAVGLVTFDEQIRAFIPPKSRRSQLMRILGELTRAAPVGKTNLAAALHRVADRVKRRGLMVLFSDLLTEPKPVIEGISHLRSRGHDVIVFQVLDKAEAEFPFDTPVRFVEPETGQAVDADPRAFRRGYLAALQEFVATYRRECHALQCDFMPVDTSMTFDKALLGFLLERQARF